ncbi:hypothetical protein H8356DRAFT_1420092 [Neocallimastix lanati (nom. inval.)]|nr:hypothetical protein H8356DRAFT_1420092 [Neocallimastix sp. JGI-2020a]
MPNVKSTHKRLKYIYKRLLVTTTYNIYNINTHFRHSNIQSETNIRNIIPCILLLNRYNNIYWGVGITISNKYESHFSVIFNTSDNHCSYKFISIPLKGSLRASKQKWYDIGALYIVILIQLRYKVVCLVLVVCCGWDNMIRLVNERKEENYLTVKN